MQTVIEEHDPRQEVAPEISVKRRSQSSAIAKAISPSDRKLLLAASFRLFLRRMNHGIAIRRADLRRLLDYADSDGEAA